jgi:hypothetical protein
MAHDAGVGLAGASSENEYVDDSATESTTLEDLLFYLLATHATRVCDATGRSEAHERIRFVRQGTLSDLEDLIHSYVFHPGNERATVVIFIHL